MPLKPSEFATYKEALDYANTRLDELIENIHEIFRELESGVREIKEQSIVLLKALKEAQT